MSNSRDRQNRSAETGDFTPISISELMRQEFADVEWLVDGLIPNESMVAISGAPGACKTWIAWNIALEVATGGALFGKFACKQGSVLIIDEENGARLLQERIKLLRSAFDLPVHLLCLEGFKITKEHVAKVAEWSIVHGVRLIILDSLVRLHSADENDASGMASVLAHLKEFNRLGISVLFIHHNRKTNGFKASAGQEMRGSSDILASLDCHLAVDRKEDNLIITQTKLRQAAEMKPFQLNMVHDENHIAFEFIGDVNEEKGKKEGGRDAIKAALEESPSPLSKKDLLERLESTGMAVGLSTLKAVIDELVEAGEVTVTSGLKNARLYQLTSTSIQESEQV